MGLHGFAQSADALYADRESLPSAIRAAAIWTDDVQRDPSSFEPAWKLARVCYWLGTHAPERERRGYLERGVTSAQRAARLQPARPEGHFWAAATMGALAEGYGLRAGLKYRKPIREALETSLRIDPSFMAGSPDRALGRYYHKVPALFGGSMTRAEQHLRTSLRYDAQSPLTHYFLAELLVDLKRPADARAELQLVLDAPLEGEWAPEGRNYKQLAAARLGTLR